MISGLLQGSCASKDRLSLSLARFSLTINLSCVGRGRNTSAGDVRKPPGVPTLFPPLYTERAPAIVCASLGQGFPIATGPNGYSTCRQAKPAAVAVVSLQSQPGDQPHPDQRTDLHSRVHSGRRYRAGPLNNPTYSESRCTGFIKHHAKAGFRGRRPLNRGSRGTPGGQPDSVFSAYWFTARSVTSCITCWIMCVPTNLRSIR